MNRRPTAALLLLLTLAVPPTRADEPVAPAGPAADEAAAAEPAAATPEAGTDRTWSDRIVVTATRADQAAAEVPLHVTVLEREEIQAGPEYTMLDFVRRIPSLTLQGTESSLVSGSIDGGAAFRGLGGTAQSRILVMVDSSPVNDPFASYLWWTRLPSEAVDRVEVIPGSVGSWGNLALTGIVNVITRGGEERTFGGSLDLGNYETLDAGLHYADVGRRWSGRLSVDALDTDGYYVFDPPERGLIDEPSGKRFYTLYGRLDGSLSASGSLRLVAASFDEDRRRGTVLNREESTDDSLAATFDQVLAGGSSLQLHAFARQVEIHELQPLDADDRDSQTPSEALTVPSEVWGASGVWFSSGKARHALRLGADAQRIAIEATRNYAWSGDAFTRSLFTEGRQQFLGAFVQDVWTVSERTSVTLGGRFDAISTSDAGRIERDLESGAVLSTTEIVDNDEENFNPSLAVVHAVGPRLRLRAAAYTGFRAGTPNELFIDSVGRNRNLSNPELSPEKLTGLELGVDLTPSSRHSTRLTAYASEARDLVERIDLGRAPAGGGVVEPCGFLAAGARCRQRRNVGVVETYGVDVDHLSRLGERWRVQLAATLLRTEITESAGNPAVVGNNVLGTPEENVNLSLGYDGRRLSGELRWRYYGSRWEDTENTLRLEAQSTFDLAASYPLHPDWTLVAGVQNLFDERYVVDVDVALPELSTPRLYHLGVRFAVR